MDSPDTRAEGSAELVLVDGKLWDGSQLPDVDAVAIRGGRILTVGRSGELETLVGESTSVIDVGGRRIIPGLIDSHIHMVRAGLRWDDLVRWNEVSTLADALGRIAEAARARAPGEWIAVLGGWHPAQFDEGRPPSLADLDDAAPDHPVYVQRGYTEGFVNSAALERVFPNAAGPEIDPVSGRIVGQAAIAACNGSLPLPDLERRIAGTRAMLREFNRLGLTGAIDAGGFGMTPELYRSIFELRERGERGFRTRLLVGPGHPGRESEQLDAWMSSASPGSGDEFVRYLGAGEVLLFAAHDMEGIDGRDVGRQVGPLADVFVRLMAAQWPVHVHAILDRSVATVLDAWEQARHITSTRGLRSAITHAEQISETNLMRLRDAGLGITIQHGLAFRGADSISTWGEDRVVSSPPLREMIDLGIPLGAGTDGTVAASYNPWMSLWWLVTGESVDGGPRRRAEHCPTRDEAMTMYTSGSAWFSNEEGTRGNLRPGSVADLAVLSEDFFTVADRRIRTIESQLTIVDGNVVHAGPPLRSSDQ